ncbi:MAG: bifunctional diaminohydroxyphosphoribosylaminopyrimidine deaminase/5-amino-6-(5-phosphoribosylamino)uracil reductase RibD [Pirellulaceae bacterium]|nr:bifunctional diaminohydroxyphosphoribosylaminopyrimidine deaminase/5-amino-6-(5-phosphoribosylamino)uracil reductase RibD [Pirellulaceae bacterium]
MNRALELAKLGLGYVEPNPLVGCVLARGDQLIAEGYHARFGGPHAELAAVTNARQAGRESLLKGCTAYVTLEPCCHHGKTPPCAQLLLDVGVQRVVVAMQDPFAAVNGGGLAQLRAAGLHVAVGLQADAAQQLNAPYLKRIQQRRPWIIAKWAMSLDGRIATASGDSQWISGPDSRQLVHQLRSRVDAILVGSGTVLADDPLLTARLPESQQPARIALRVVVDSQLSVATTSRLVRTARQFPTLFWTGPQETRHKAQALRELGCQVEHSHAEDPQQRLNELLELLGDRYSATNVLVEGGGQLLGSLFDQHQIDQCEVFIATKLIGGSGAISPLAGRGIDQISQGPHVYAVQQASVGMDVHVSCRLDWINRQAAG